MQSPNLFAFATSELSQDAFICWLLSWAAQNYKDSDALLHEVSINLLNKFFEIQQKTPPTVYSSISIERQYKKIDVYVIINNEYGIIIEDKTNTASHSGQLPRYVTLVEAKEIKEGNIVKIYFKTGDQSNYDGIRKDGFSPFLREHFLEILKNGADRGINNQIFLDYYNYLQKIDKDIDGFKTLPIDKWRPQGKGWEWIGFYKELQKHFPKSEWRYVHNASGGFYGFWWHADNPQEDCNKYLQLEDNKLCFKISVEDKEKREKLRNDWHAAVMTANSEFKFNIIRPRFKPGKHMTAAVLEEYRMTKDGLIDIEETVAFLKSMEKLLDASLKI